MPKKKAFVSTILVMLLLTALAGCGQNNSADTNTNNTAKTVEDNYVVKLGYYNCDHMVGACIAKDAGIFDKLGVKVDVTGNGQVPQAMAAAQMES